MYPNTPAYVYAFWDQVYRPTFQGKERPFRDKNQFREYVENELGGRVTKDHHLYINSDSYPEWRQITDYKPIFERVLST